MAIPKKPAPKSKQAVQGKPKPIPANKGRAPIVSPVSAQAETPRSELAAAPILRPIGRPPAPGDFTKATLSLRLNDVLWLDQLSIDIRKTTGQICDRGAVLRGLLSGIREAGISLDLQRCSTEEEIASDIKARLCII